MAKIWSSSATRNTAAGFMNGFWKLSGLQAVLYEFEFCCSSCDRQSSVVLAITTFAAMLMTPISFPRAFAAASSARSVSPFALPQKTPLHFVPGLRGDLGISMIIPPSARLPIPPLADNNLIMWAFALKGKLPLLEGNHPAAERGFYYVWCYYTDRLSSAL